MYDAFYGLTQAPFGLSPDVYFCYRYPTYARATAYMQYALHRGEGFVVVTGRPGMGKTTLIQDLLRDLRDRHPHRVRVHTADPRTLAGALIRLPHVRELSITGEDRLEFVTEHPELAYRELPGIIHESGALVSRMETLDNTLEAVFTHVTEAGARRP